MRCVVSVVLFCVTHSCNLLTCSVESTEQKGVNSAYTQYLSQMLNMAAGLGDSVCWIMSLTLTLSRYFQQQRRHHNYSRTILQFLTPLGRYVALIIFKFVRQIWHAKFHIHQVMFGVSDSENAKNPEFCEAAGNKIPPDSCSYVIVDCICAKFFAWLFT